MVFDLIYTKIEVAEPSHDKILKFKLKVKNKYEGGGWVEIWDARGTLHASSSSSPEKFFIGEVKGRPSLVLQSGQKEADYYLEINLNDILLDKLEKIRKKDRLRFYINSEFLLRIYPFRNSIHNISSYIMFYTTIADQLFLKTKPIPVSSLDNSIIEITNEEWIDILSKFGFKKVKILEIPDIASYEKDETLNAILKSINKAWELMLEDQETSLNECRKALEGMKNYVKQYDRLTNNGDIDFKKIYRSDSYGDNMEKIFKALWSLVNRGSHLVDKPWRRSDMEFIMVTTSILIENVINNLRKNLNKYE
ncbi:MAG: hypothetical protein QXK74_07340 [Candidatus Nitrosocaldaceae archaeon]